MRESMRILTLTQNIVKVNQKPSKDNLRRKMFLKVGLLVGNVVLVRKGAAEVRQSNYSLELPQPRKPETELEIQAASRGQVSDDNLEHAVRGGRGMYVSMIEQCQKIRRIRSARGDDSSAGLL